MNTFEVKKNDLTIRGTVFGKSNTKKPAIICSHGFLDIQQSQFEYCKLFESLGFVAVCFDFCGGSTKSTSDGRLVDMTVLTETEDLKCVINYVKSLDYVDAEHISLLGCSQGGFVSAIVASELNTFDHLILCYPAFSIPHDAKQGSMLDFKFDSDNIPEVIHGPVDIGRNYAYTMQAVDPYELCSGYKGKTLIIHGNADTAVDIKYSKQALSIYPDVTFVEIDGAPHVFKGEYDEIAKNAMISFINK